jgi:hypothetical protein
MEDLHQVHHPGMKVTDLTTTARALRKVAAELDEDNIIDNIIIEVIIEVIIEAIIHNIIMKPNVRLRGRLSPSPSSRNGM